MESQWKALDLCGKAVTLVGTERRDWIGTITRDRKAHG